MLCKRRRNWYGYPNTLKGPERGTLPHKSVRDACHLAWGVKIAEFSLTQGVQDQKLTFLSINVSLCVVFKNNKMLSSCVQCFEARFPEPCPDWSPYILYEFHYDDRLAYLTTYQAFLERILIHKRNVTHFQTRLNPRLPPRALKHLPRTKCRNRDRWPGFCKLEGD